MALAARNNNVGLVAYLLSKGVSPEFRNSNNETALDEARIYGASDTFNMLANLSLEKSVANQAALQTLNTKLLTAIQGAPIPATNHDDDNGEFSFDDVCEYGYTIDYDEIVTLIEQGANPNIIDQNGRTALMNAAFQDNLRLTKILLHYGANPHYLDSKNQTAAMIADKAGATDIVDMINRRIVSLNSALLAAVDDPIPHFKQVKQLL